MSRRFQIKMTFEGYQAGDTSHEAIQEFKKTLGLAPEAMRSEIHMTNLSAFVVDEEKDSLKPDVEHAESHPGPAESYPGPGRQVNTMDMSVIDE